MADDSLPLADAVRALREQLKIAAEAARGESLQFTVGPAVMELTTVLTSEGSVDGKASFKVVGIGFEAGATGRLEQERTHKLTLTLTPTQLDPGGGSTDVKVAGEAAASLGARRARSREA
jgi:hypothetical protein